VSGHTITIEGLADVTAGGVANLSGACDGAKARFERANRDGGVNGFKINYLGCHDTGSSPDTTTTLTQKAVEQDRIFAMVPYSTFAGDGPLLNQTHTPYFGFGISPPAYCGWTSLQFSFSVTSAESCTTAFSGASIFSSVGPEAYLKGANIDPHTVKEAIIGGQTAENIAAVKAEALIGKAIGMQVVYTTTSLPGPTSPPPSDYTPYAQAIIHSGANFVFNIAGTTNETLGVAAALKANGYTGGQIQFVINGADALRVPAISQALDGTYSLTPQIGSPVFPSASFSQLASDLKAIGFSAGPGDVGTLTSYGAADLFLAALAKVQEPLTTEKLAAVLNNGFNYPGIGNVVCGSTWPAAHVAASNCGATVQLNGTALKPVTDMGDIGASYFVKTG
jgi:ABC-type branched-subunit amino acid transport system substrate-binding protein